MDVNLNVSDPKVQAAIQQALLAGLSEQAKAEIIGQAVTYLVTPEKSSYGEKRQSPLSMIVQNAAHQEAWAWVRKEMENPEGPVRKELSRLFEAVVARMREKVVSDAFEKIVEKFLSSIISKIENC